MKEINIEPEALSRKMLEKALEEVLVRLNTIKCDLKLREQELVSAEEEERLLRGLLGLRGGESERIPPAQQPMELSSVQDIHSELPRSRHPSIDAVVSVLTEAGSPMHIGELMRRLHADNVKIPGAGLQANLISHLRRDPRIVRTSRGVYGLVEWGLTEGRPLKKKRRTRKKIVRSNVRARERGKS